MFPPLDGSPDANVRSVGESFATPHTFNPNFTFSGAVIAVVVSFGRIFLGSLLFAVWGVGALMIWSRIPNAFWRAMAVAPLVLLFLAAFAALMIAISAVARWFAPRHS
jgi:hypothetical protein